MEKDQRNVYYMKEFIDNDIAAQLNRSNNVLKTNNKIENNFNAYQGQIVEYLHYDFSKNKFYKLLAIVLGDSTENQNDVIICPLKPLLEQSDLKQGINVGKILTVSTEFDFIAPILGIRNVSKRFIRVNNQLNKNWIGYDCVSKIIQTYRNFLRNILKKQGEVIKEFTC